MIDPPDTAKPPRGLAGAGRAEWNRQIEQLIDAGVLTAADLGVFEDYCRALTELRLYEAAAKRAGSELAIAKGYQGMVTKLRAQVNQLRRECGLTPTSRRGVKADKQRSPASGKPVDKYLRVIAGGRGAK